MRWKEPEEDSVSGMKSESYSEQQNQRRGKTTMSKHQVCNWMCGAVSYRSPGRAENLGVVPYRGGGHSHGKKELQDVKVRKQGSTVKE